jgi:hypothetical protein
LGFLASATNHNEEERKEIKVGYPRIRLQKFLVPGVVLSSSCQFKTTDQRPVSRNALSNTASYSKESSITRTIFEPLYTGTVDLPAHSRERGEMHSKQEMTHSCVASEDDKENCQVVVPAPQQKQLRRQSGGFQTGAAYKFSKA